MKSFETKLMAVVVLSILLVVIGMGISRKPKGQIATIATTKNELKLLEFESTSLDAGSCMYDHEHKVFTFVCRNNTSSAVTIDAVEADCSCSNPKFDKLIRAGQQSRISIAVAPSLHKRMYSASLRATQNGIQQIENLAVLLEVVEPNSSLVTPQTLFLGKLILDESFTVEQTLRIATSDGKPLEPLAISGPDWLKVDFKPIDDWVLLMLSGQLPTNRNSSRGRIHIKLPPPNKDQSVEFTDSPHAKYEVVPHRLFGSIRDKPDGRSITLSGVTNEVVSVTVTMEGLGKVDVVKGNDPTQFIVTPEFPDGCLEVGGKIAWTIITEEGSLVAELVSSFFFMKLDPRGGN